MRGNEGKTAGRWYTCAVRGGHMKTYESDRKVDELAENYETSTVAGSWAKGEF